MTDIPTTAAAVVSNTKPLLLDFLAKTEANLMIRFGDFVHSAHVGELRDVILQCGRARVELFCAQTQEAVAEWDDVYKTNEARLETIGMEVAFVGKIDSRQFLRDEIAMGLSYIPAVAGIIVKVALPLALPGIGSVIAPFAGTGLEWLLDKAMGVPTK